MSNNWSERKKINQSTAGCIDREYISEFEIENYEVVGNVNS